jgi:hypothetical protein
MARTAKTEKLPRKLAKLSGLSVTQTGAASFLGTGAVTLPIGTTAQRPDPASNGMVRVNSDTDTLEYYNSGEWQALQGVSPEPGYATITKDVFITDAGGEFYGPLSLTPNSANGLIVYLDNVIQEPDYNFSLVEDPELGTGTTVYNTSITVGGASTEWGFSSIAFSGIKGSMDPGSFTVNGAALRVAQSNSTSETFEVRLENTEPGILPKDHFTSVTYEYAPGVTKTLLTSQVEFYNYGYHFGTNTTIWAWEIYNPGPQYWDSGDNGQTYPVSFEREGAGTPAEGWYIQFDAPGTQSGKRLVVLHGFDRI